MKTKDFTSAVCSCN